MATKPIEYIRGLARWAEAKVADRESADVLEVVQLIEEALLPLDEEDFFGTEGSKHAFGLD